MPDEKPWFNELEDEFMGLIGKCITSWAHIEEEMFKMCKGILETSDEHTAIVYYRTPTIDARLSLLDELVRTVFPKTRSASK